MIIPGFSFAESNDNNRLRSLQDSLNDNCGKHEFTVPDLAPGDYLVRAEAIALHVASQPDGAQFYMTCYQGESSLSNLSSNHETDTRNSRNHR